MSSTASENGPERYPIGVVSRRTGLPAHTIRSWEERFGVVEPTRSERKFRRYTEAQIRTLHLLSRLTDLGWRIGEIAGRSDAALRELLQEELRRSPEAAAISRYDPAQPYRRARAALEAPDPLELREILTTAGMQLDFHTFVGSVAEPLLSELECPGDAESTFRASLLRAALAAAFRRIRVAVELDSGAPLALVSTPEGDRHELGMEMAATTAVMSGWQPVPLPGLSPEAMARAAAEMGVDAVAVSLVWDRGDPQGLGDALGRLRRDLDGAIPVMVGGRAVRESLGADLLPEGVLVPGGLAELELELASRPPA